MRTVSRALSLAVLLLFAGAAQAGGPEAQTRRIDVSLKDLELVDQDGRKVRFKSDVVGGRVAVIIPFYTTCTTSYPILVYTFTRLQDLLGDRLGNEVALVSVSVDPRTDIPIRLKDFARRQKARSGWTFLTGNRNNLTLALFGMGILFSQDLDSHNHTPLTVVGGEGREWKRFYGFPSPELLLAQVDAIMGKGEESGGGKR